MKKRLRQSIALLFTAIMTVTCFSGVAFAASGEMNIESVDSGFVVMGTPVNTVSINVSGRNVTMTDNAFSAEREDSITATAYLQQLRDGVWYTVYTATASATYSYSVTTSKIVTVSGGYYYRVKGINTTITDGVVKSVTAYTSQRWVD